MKRLSESISILTCASLPRYGMHTVQTLEDDTCTYVLSKCPFPDKKKRNRSRGQIITYWKLGTRKRIPGKKGQTVKRLLNAPRFSSLFVSKISLATALPEWWNGGIMKISFSDW